MEAAVVAYLRVDVAENLAIRSSVGSEVCVDFHPPQLRLNRRIIGAFENHHAADGRAANRLDLQAAYVGVAHFKHGLFAVILIVSHWRRRRVECSPPHIQLVPPRRQFTDSEHAFRISYALLSASPSAILLVRSFPTYNSGSR